MFNLPNETYFQCIQTVNTYEDPHGRFRQATVQATVSDCRDFIVRMGHYNSTWNHTTEFVVWPDMEYDSFVYEGQLVDLDNGTRHINATGNEFITVRINEMATPTGYAWHAPNHNFSCVDLINTNLGDYKTGVTQWLFQAKQPNSA